MQKDERTVDEYLLDESRIWGDHFTDEQVAQWVQDEREAYAELSLDTLAATSRRSYPYSELNHYYGFSRLTSRDEFEHVLGLGAADGAELDSISRQTKRFTIVEPTERFDRQAIGGTAARYIRASVTGDLQVNSNSVDLVTCFGVLHHVARVSHLLTEIGRVLRPGGAGLIREPIVSMGDWRQARTGLTERERGIPLTAFEHAIISSGLQIESLHLCMFSLTRHLGRLLRVEPYNHRWLVRVDKGLSRLTRPLYRYHATHMWQKIRPTSVFVIVKKPTDQETRQ